MHQQQRQRREPLLAVDDKFLGIPFADDDGAEKIMAIAVYR
jgi:hypothetical protein